MVTLYKENKNKNIIVGFDTIEIPDKTYYVVTLKFPNNESCVDIKVYEDDEENAKRMAVDYYKAIGIRGAEAYKTMKGEN